jgi:hypothetical protein
MISLRMIVRYEFRDGAPKVVFAKEEHTVQTLLLDRSHKTFRVRVVRTPSRSKNAATVALHLGPNGR